MLRNERSPNTRAEIAFDERWVPIRTSTDGMAKSAQRRGDPSQVTALIIQQVIEIELIMLSQNQK